MKKLNLKGVWSLRDMLFTFIIISFIIVGMQVFIFGAMDRYGIIPDGNLTKMYNNVNATLGESYSMSKDFQGRMDSDEVSFTGGEADVLGSLWTTLKLPFTMLSSIYTLIGTGCSLLGIPMWVYNTFITLVLITIGAIIITIALRTTGA